MHNLKIGMENNQIIQFFKEDFIKIKNMGPVKSKREGDTGIGKTFSDLLGIDESNESHPTYGNIKIKTQRDYANTKLSLFTKNPDYPKSAITKMTKKFGKPSKMNYLQNTLNTTITTSPNVCYNNWGFYIEFNDDKLYLKIYNYASNQDEEDIYYIKINKLREIFNKNYHILAYVNAIHSGKNPETFHYIGCDIFIDGSFDRFVKLLKMGKIVYEIRVSVDESGKQKDHGSGFRISKSDLNHLFRSHYTILENGDLIENINHEQESLDKWY